MKRTLKVLTALSVILLFTIPGIFAQQAFIQDLTGTVEVKRASSAAWEPAARGLVLTGDTIISTGFRSTARIALGNSILTVRPITRLTLRELSQMQDAEKIDLNLQIGRVRADVKAPPSGRTAFSIQSPTATASVRGTAFEFDTFNLKVSEGTVLFSGSSGEAVVVDAGRTSFVDGSTGRTVPPELTRSLELRPDRPVSSDMIRASEPSASTENSMELSVSIFF